MRALRSVGKVLLVLAFLPLAVLLVASLPLAAYNLVTFLFGQAALGLFAPGVAVYVLGFCVPVGLYQWSHMGKPSRPCRLPQPLWLGLGAAAAIGLGQVLLATRSGGLFWALFVAAAALPPLAALALAVQRLGPITTWRRALAGILSGSLLSTHLAIALSALVSVLAYLLVLPLRELVARVLASRSLEELFYSPALTLAMVELALVAPVVEELTKPLAALLLARRLRGPAEAFLVGMAGGVGFAILENMLYEAAGARVWASIAVLRGVGGVLHPLNAGLVAVGWYGVRHGLPGAWKRLLGFYGLAVGLHALWNGGLVILYSGLGAYFLGTTSWELNVYGIGQPGVMIVALLVEAIAMWRLLFLVTAWLRHPARSESPPLLGLHLEHPRTLALWATAAALLVVPLAALYGPLLARYLQIALPVR
ncbi:MAG: PrsW family intramembrane metalloprotease [Chloroflexi bacterium]|nr:PrsW family intramembrane metalloprotease [Chloroflexota bacterium]